MRALVFLTGIVVAGCGSAADREGGCRPLPAPATLSGTRCYDDVASAVPVASAIRYELNAPAWGDGDVKRRWFVLPEGATVGFRELDSWEMPVGTVLVKEFFRDGLPVETRFLVRLAAGGIPEDWSGTTYRWREDASDADLVPAEGEIAAVRGVEHIFPSQADCARCHTPAAGGPLGLQTPNVNRGAQLEDLAARGIFGETFAPSAAHPKMAATDDTTESFEARSRSWLHANCAHCHREGAEMGSRAWGPWYVPLAETALCASAYDGTPFLAAGDPEGSRLLQRVLSSDAPMPPIANLVPDPLGIDVLGEWIRSLATCSPREGVSP